MIDKSLHAILFKPPIEQNFIGHQMSEIYRDGVYHSLVDGRNDMVILDIGANIGVTAYYFSRFAKKVVAVEPATEHFTVLANMIMFNGLDNVVPVKKAIYIKEGKFPLFTDNPNKTMYSLNMVVNNGTQGHEDVDCITLKQLFEEQEIDRVDLMKLDCEGAEVEILSHSDFVELAPRINQVVLETHAWNGRNPQQIKDALEQVGYEVVTIPTSANMLLATRKK